MYLFDTDIVSNLLKKRPSSELIKKLASISPDQQFISAITVGELVYGAYRSTRPDYFLGKLDQQVWPNVQILSFDEKAAHTYGLLRDQLERGGIPLAEPDLRIASIAISKQLTLVTGNVRHFSRIARLRIENWL
ncbi:MAG: type II toxin-antitoxin system VapC family toxin [Deltaproteobacteria bacterium]|nr:type II toxin-antitoxin system VapC family toxin [Deltaproteobacteria bacterium]